MDFSVLFARYWSIITSYKSNNIKLLTVLIYKNYSRASTLKSMTWIMDFGFYFTSGRSFQVL